MSLREHIQNALRSIKANKLRTALSSLWIIIGVSSVIILLAFWEGTQRSITTSIQSLGTNLLTLAPGGSKSTNVRNTTSVVSNTNVFTLQDIQLLTGLDEINGISPQINGKRQVVYGSNNLSESIYGVTPDYQAVHSLNLQFGSFISNDDVKQGAKVAVIWPDVVTNVFNKEDPLGKSLRIGNTFFTVIWVTEAKGGNWFNNTDSVIYIPVTTAQSRIFGSQYLSQIAVQIKNSSAIDSMKTKITSIFLNKFHISEADSGSANFSIMSSADMLSTITSVTDTLKLFLWGIAAISLLVWGIGVMNIMLVSVSERTREIGIRRSIGARNLDIILQFLTESVVLTILGWLIWVGLSRLVVTIMQNVGVAAYITTYVVALSFWCAVSVGIVFWLLPAYKAAKLKPIDALRSE